MVNKNYVSLKNYLKAFFYFLLITILLSFSTVVLHELGHFIFGLISGCHSVKIILFDIKLMTTYTEMECPPTTKTTLLGLSGMFVVIPLVILLFLVGKGADKYLAIIMLGFNLTISIWDLEKYLNIQNAEILGVIGIVLIVLGEILLIEKSIF